MPSYERNKLFTLRCIYADDRKLQLTCQDANGREYKVSAEGNLKFPITGLKDKDVELKCTELNAGIPVFELSKDYFGPRSVLATPLITKIRQDEGQEIEFKSSLMFAPGEKNPTGMQFFNIAKEVAAFMNADGGILYIGVKDDGTVCGIAGDFSHLQEADVQMGTENDNGYSYSADWDGFQRKLMCVLKGYLGTNFADKLKVLVQNRGYDTYTYVEVVVPPSKDALVYTDAGKGGSLFRRLGAACDLVRDADRDRFVLDRLGKKNEDFLTTIMSLNEDLAKQVKELLEKQPATAKDVRGTKLHHTDVYPITSDEFKNFKGKVATLYYKANVEGEEVSFNVKKPTWGEVYVALLKILANLKPKQFSQLPADPVLNRKRGNASPNFSKRGDHVNLKEPSDYLGPQNDIRAARKNISSVSFTDESKLPRRLIRAFGLNPEDFAIKPAMSTASPLDSMATTEPEALTDNPTGK